MRHHPDIHHRRSIRLRGYDYSQAGAYFVTICTQNRECLLGDIADGKMQLNKFGKIIKSVWNDLPNHYLNVRLDEYVIMPNHFHGIMVLTDNPDVGVGAGLKPAPTESEPAPTVGKRHGLPEIVRGFKTFSSRRINQTRNTPGVKLWQRNYYEHIVRNENELNRIREYITNNPAKWESDQNFPMDDLQTICESPQSYGAEVWMI